MIGSGTKMEVTLVGGCDWLKYEIKVAKQRLQINGEKSMHDMGLGVLQQSMV